MRRFLGFFGAWLLSCVKSKFELKSGPAPARVGKPRCHKLPRQVEEVVVAASEVQITHHSIHSDELPAIGPTGLSCRLAGCQATPVGAIRTKLRLAAVGFIATIREDDDVLLTDTPTCENPA